MFGLGDADTGSDFSDIDFAIHLQAGGALMVYESGTYRGSFGSYAAGDVLRIGVFYPAGSDNPVVRYFKNGFVFYTSTIIPPFPLRADSSLAETNSEIREPRFGRGSCHYSGGGSRPGEGGNGGNGYRLLHVLYRF
jgi:hypothetical protein